MSDERQFVLQFRIKQEPAVAFDKFMDIEEKLDQALRQNQSGYIDGHDFGNGTMNLFMICPDWQTGDQFLSLYLRYQSWVKEVVIAKDKREMGFEVVFPVGYKGVFEL